MNQAVSSGRRMGLPVASHPPVQSGPVGVPSCLSSPHGSQREAVGQVGVVGQQCGKQVAGTGVHGHALPEQHFSKATERTPCRGSLRSASGCGLAWPLPRSPHTPGSECGMGRPRIE